MPTQKIKFKMSLKELSFEFEGDVETGQRIQSDIRKSLTSLTHSPAAVIPPDPNVIDGEVVPALTNDNANGKASKQRRNRRPKGDSAQALIIGLRHSGFFDQKRDAGSIREELKKSGHNFEAKEIAASLIPICKKRILKRDKAEGGNYEYEKGDADAENGTGEDA
jgi:hypothetical protein